MNVKDALHQLPVARNTKRLLPLWADIEAKLAAGVSQTEIVALLNGNGFDMSLDTFKTYLHRQRKRSQRAARGQSAKPIRSVAAATQASGVVAPATSPPITAVKVGATRPPTFDYDPRGIPDLLK